MIRRAPLRLSILAATAAVGATGCATFTDANVAARVGDAELTHDRLDGLRAQTLAEFGDAPAGEANRFITQAFVLVEAIRSDLGVLGVTTPEPVEATTLGDFQAELQQLGALWQSVPADQIVDDRVAARYNDADASLVCTAHILAETKRDADAALERLDSGESFAAVAAELSGDPGSAANGGRLDCMPLATFETTFVPEFVEGAAPLSPGDVSAPVQSQFGYHVITKVPLADIDPSALFPIRLESLGERFDIFVDPLIGEWVGDGSIAPLG